jgi:hypothetical protein
MSSDHDPVRLGADTHTSPWLRSLLSKAHAEASDALDVDRLTARVQAAILVDAPVLSGPPAHHAPLGKLVASKAVWLGAGVVIGMSIGTAWMLKRAPLSAPRPSVSVAQPLALVPLKALTQEVSSSPSAAVAGETDAISQQAPAVSTNSPSASRDIRGVGLNEAALLDGARAALGTDPRRALALTQEHAKRFPHGALIQEREVIAIDALSRLGQTDVARRRASDFERRYPGSAHQPKVDQTTRGQ